MQQQPLKKYPQERSEQKEQKQQEKGTVQMSYQTSKLKLMFWLNTLSTTGEKHLFQTDQNAILKDLGNDIKQNGLRNPIILAISKKTERAYIYEGNLNWVPLMLDYLLLNDGDDTRFCPVPRTVNGNWPSNPNPSNFGFETRPI